MDSLSTFYPGGLDQFGRLVPDDLIILPNSIIDLEPDLVEAILDTNWWISNDKPADILVSYHQLIPLTALVEDADEVSFNASLGFRHISSNHKAADQIQGFYHG